MIQTVLKNDHFEWLDVNAPSFAELHELAERRGLHPKMVEDCLDPEHLPKYERTPRPENDTEAGFLITRIYDPSAARTADTTQKLTRKIAIFFGPGYLISIHRSQLPALDELKETWTRSKAPPFDSPFLILTEIINAAIQSFEKPLEDCEDAYERFERHLFANHDVVPQLKAIHLIKRRLSVFRRLLWHTHGAVQRLQPPATGVAPHLQDIRENAEGNYMYADDLLESLDALVHTQLAMASHRTNEIVRLLTIFSVFFMPLTFIVGIYGMNFQYMPELRQPWGYPAVLGAMLAISALIFVWFRRKGYFR